MGVYGVEYCYLLERGVLEAFTGGGAVRVVSVDMLLNGSWGVVHVAV